MRIIVINHLTLDGVMQGPGRPDEDTRGGFSHGGWAIPGNDPAIFQAMGERITPPGGGMLLGRRSYEDMLTVWNARGGPFKDALNSAAKYVVSSSATTRLEWPNSSLVHGDIFAVLAEFKRKPEGNLVIMGSGQLIRSLVPRNLIDEYLLMIHPLIVGSGQRMFEQGAHSVPLQLISSTVASTGVIIAAYRPI